MANISDGLDFYRHGSRDAFAAVAAEFTHWQAVVARCGGCGTRYLASVERRHPPDDSATVCAYPDVVGQTVLVERTLLRECPDHPYRIRASAFTVVA